MKAEVIIEDVQCCDCQGPVTAFAVPDGVWDGLGFALGDFACVKCVGRRVNPKMNPEHVRYWLAREIWKQRSRFKLTKPPFRALGVSMPTCFAYGTAEEVSSVLREKAINRGTK